LNNIAKKLDLQLPSEIVSIYENINRSFCVFDTRSIGEHWLLNADYFLVKPEDYNTKERGEYFIKDFYVNEDKNILESINREVLASIKEHWSEDKAFIFAWSNDVVEKDASLVYLFNDDGSVKGIYVHSLNFVEHKVFVAKSLSEVFNLEKPHIEANKVRFTTAQSQEVTPSYQELLKGTYKIIDLESVDDVKDYEYLIKVFINLSKEKFSPIIKKLSEQNTIRSIEIEINHVSYAAQLQGDTDYIDLKIIDFVNSCLVDQGHTRKKFIAFRDINFGQEAGIAFVSRSGLKALKEIKTLRLLKE